jgi:spermidine synthase
LNSQTHTSTNGLLGAVFALSCGILGFEIALMRVLLYASWHHFAFLVISVALLGFGASGTLLCFLRPWLMRKGDAALFFLIVATAVAIPAAVQLVRHVPVEARFIPTLLARQMLHWAVYWAILLCPFLLGATAIGLALMRAGPRLPTVYAANLTGSAVGAVLATVLMYRVAPAWLAAWMGGCVLISALLITRNRSRAIWLVGVTFCAGIWLAVDPPRIRLDPYKYLSYVHRLQNDNNARQIAEAYGPRAVVEAFAGEVFHDLPFLSAGESPPPIIPLVIDGQSAGSLLQVSDREAAGVVDGTLMSLPYAFVRRPPRVLLLGETGGANIWLALRNKAGEVRVVQPNRQLIALLANPLREEGGLVFELPGVGVIASEPRHFVDQTSDTFDLIQLVSMESWAVETGGIGGLNQDYLVTVEGLAKCLDRLSSDGILSVGRGIQLPPRDNIKLLNTLLIALRRIGVERPADHVVVVRDYLAACTMIKRSRWRATEIDRLRTVAMHRELTPVYFPGVRDNELNQPDRLPGPEGERGDWLHHATTRLLSPDADRFIARWAFDIRAPTDNRPFFGNFTKLQAIGMLKQAFGDLWLTRTELALLFVLAAMAIIAIVGLLLTVFPLLWIGDVRRSRGLGVTALYFVAIGLAYLMLEITLLSRLIHLIGEPVLAGSAAIAGFLLFSGLGSLVAQKIQVSQPTLVRRLIVALVAVGMAEAALIGWVTSLAGSLPIAVRFAVAMAIIGPLGFLMGFPMPSALRRLQTGTPVLIPWAWGVNGFASVLAPPLATAIGMIAGFGFSGAAALILYLVAAWVFHRLPAAASGIDP